MNEPHLNIAAEEDVDGDHAGRHQLAHVQRRQVALRTTSAIHSASNPLPHQGATHELLVVFNIAARA